MPEIVPPQMLTVNEVLALFPQPLRLVIEGYSGSGKTWLAQTMNAMWRDAVWIGGYNEETP